jgi:hypothetical protein
MKLKSLDRLRWGVRAPRGNGGLKLGADGPLEELEVDLGIEIGAIDRASRARRRQSGRDVFRRDRTVAGLADNGRQFCRLRVGQGHADAFFGGGGRLNIEMPYAVIRARRAEGEGTYPQGIECSHHAESNGRADRFVPKIL